MSFWSRPRSDKLHYTAKQRHDTSHHYHVWSGERQTPAMMALPTYVRRGMHRLGLTMENDDHPARKIRHSVSKARRGTAGISWRVIWSPVTKAEAEEAEKVSTQTLWCFRPCKEHPKLESGSSASRGRKTKPAGSRNRKLAPGANILGL
jgi:hypothetical protein